MECFGQAGAIGSYKGRGVWVPPGLTAEEIGVGADALMRELGNFLELRNRYEALQIARVVLEAVQKLRQ